VDRAHSRDDKLHRLDENLGGVSLQLTAEDLTDIEGELSKIAVQGERYLPAAQAWIDR
jgi:hypothetical protein